METVYNSNFLIDTLLQFTTNPSDFQMMMFFYMKHLKRCLDFHRQHSFIIFGNHELETVALKNGFVTINGDTETFLITYRGLWFLFLYESSEVILYYYSVHLGNKC